MVKKSVMDMNKNISAAPSGLGYEKYARHHKQPREDVEQFVRLIRDYPLPKQTAEFAFMKNKIPLPEIGQSKCTVTVTQCGEDVDHVSEPVVQHRAHSVSDNGEHCDIDKSEQMLFQKVMHHRHATSDLIPLDRTSSSIENCRQLMSSSLSAHPAIPLDFDAGICSKQKLARTRSDPTRRRATADIRNLPPLTVNRQAFIECPTRPSAPSPTCTPPLPTSDDDAFPEEEPDDFIDTH